MSKSIHDALMNSNAIIEFDVYGHILWANSHFLNLMEYQLEEIAGQHHSIFLPEISLHELNYLDWWSRLSMGETQTGEFRCMAKNKRLVWIQGSYSPVRDENGTIVKILKVAVDITEKKTLAESLDKKNRALIAAAAKAKAAMFAKSVFLANMSHEIRTPLNSIIGITDTLAETTLNQQQSSYVEILQRANSQLITIINDVLELSKVEAGEFELKPVPFDLRKLLNEVISVLSFRAREKGLSLQVQIEPNVSDHLMGDSDRLRQVLMNLINNAIKFTHHGGITLCVSTNYTSRPGTILFSVADTGIGIQKSKFKDIFLPFTQADATTTRRYGGTGLGLSITKNIVELMNGQIWLESDSGIGSVFYVTATMPPTNLKSPVKSIFHSTQSSLTRAVPEKKLRLLVVDDVDDNRHLLGIYLDNTGHEISYAASGEDALSLVKNNNFDVIFMDIQMPNMDGHEATRRIRKMEAEVGRSPTRIFACTANAFTEDIEKSLNAGCDLHLSKPIRKDILLKAIQTTFIADGDMVC